MKNEVLPVLRDSLPFWHPSRSAEVQGHGGTQPPPVTGKEDVKISRLEPVGNYAVRIVFDDGHDTGLYSWDYLRKLAER